MTLHVEGFHSFTDVSLDPAGKVRELEASHKAYLSHVAESKVPFAVRDYKQLGTPETMAPSGISASNPKGIYCKAVT